MLLELTNIDKSYEKAGIEARQVLKGLSLEVKKGETMAILGPSGSGKSTLLNIMGALDTPGAGDVKFNGIRLNDYNEDQLADFRNREVGFIFQSHYLLPQCTVFENVMIPVLATGDKKTRTDREKFANELIHEVGLWEHRNKLPGQLSGGECQRVAVIRALINHPKILLADEPTGSLDNENALSIVSLMLKLNAQYETALVVVTHSREVGDKLGKAYLLKSGKLELAK